MTNDLTIEVEAEKSFRDDDVRATYRFLAHIHETEIRLLDPNKLIPPKSIFVKTEDEFVQICKKYNGQVNIYAGINERRTGGTKNADVNIVKTIIVDIDGRRPNANQTAANVGELECARICTEDIVKNLIQRFECMPFTAMSGNGYQLWIAIHPINLADRDRDVVAEQLKQFQREVIQFSERHIGAQVDPIGDLSRICKVIGTHSIKGENTLERPWRRSRWIGIAPMRNDCTKLQKYILDIPVTKKDVSVPIGTTIDDDALQHLIEHDKWLQEMLAGEIENHGHTDRSSAEQAVLTRLIQYGLSKEQIWKIMEVCQIGKWQERNDASYRENSYENAMKFTKEKGLSIYVAPLSKQLTIRTAEEFCQLYENWKLDYFINPLLPKGSRTLLVGKRSSFKSFIAMDMARALALGENWMGNKTEKVNTLLMDLENGPERTTRRLHKVKARLGGIYILDARRFKFEESTRELLAFCSQRKIGVIVIDSLRRVHGYDENDAAAINDLFEKYLNQFAFAGITLLMIYHARKGQGSKSTEDDLMDSIRGSSEFVNNVDNILFCQRKTGSQVTKLTELKNRDNPEEDALFINIVDEPDPSGNEELNKVHFVRMSNNIEGGDESMLDQCITELCKWVEEYQGAFFKRKEIDDNFKDTYRHATLSDALDALKSKGIIQTIKRGFYERVKQNLSTYSSEKEQKDEFELVVEENKLGEKTKFPQ